MNKYKSNKQKESKLSLSPGLSTLSTCSNEQVLIYNLTQRKENNELETSKMSLCVCTAANENVLQALLYMLMRVDLCCAAILVVVAG